MTTTRYERQMDDDTIDESVAEHGWHAISVDDGEPPFQYTCGLLSRLRHPELIIVGLDSEVAYDVLFAIVEKLYAGRRVEAGTRLELPGGLPIAVGAVHPTRHPFHFGHAMAHARRHGVALRALQVYWPDPRGRLPSDLACDCEVAALQPRLSLRATPSELRAFRALIGDLD